MSRGNFQASLINFARCIRKTVSLPTRILRNNMRTQQAGSPNPMSEKDIILDVLGPRRGHVRGVGRVVTGASTSTSVSNARSTPTERYYSQTEVDNMTAQIEARVEARMEERMRSVAAKAVRKVLRGSGLPFNPPSSDFPHTSDDEQDD